MKFNIRKVNKSDLMLIFKWANDPLVRKMSFNQNQIPLKVHKEWFYKAIKEIYFFIIELDSIPIAQVRIDKNGEISMAICKKYRGKHLATPIINNIVAFMKESHNMNTEFIAYIKSENLSSIKAFKKAGFKFDGHVKHKNHLCHKFIFDN